MKLFSLFPSPSLGVAVLASAAVFGACAGTSTSSSGFTPITGVLVRADALVSGIGCGTRSDQVFKYAAVVTQGNVTLTVPDVNNTPIGVGRMSDCFADAKFANLRPGPDGKLSFSVQIYAFSKDLYLAQQAKGLDAAATDWTELQKFAPTYKTTCSATQQQDVEVLAVCEPLKAGGPASILIDTTSFNGGALSCAKKSYAKVQAFFRAGTGIGEIDAVDCPNPLVITPALAPETYSIDVQLLDATGTKTLGALSCTAKTVPHFETTADCVAAQ